MFNIKNDVLIAGERIRPYVRETILDHSPFLSKSTQGSVFLKCENLQYTGAFKVRGAFNKLLSLSAAQLQQGIVTASSGNHGAAVAFGLDKLHLSGVVFVPENASAAKIENIRNYNVQLEFFGNDCMLTEIHAMEYAKLHNMTYISPYNDRDVIAGQGTIGLEIMRQLKKVDVILVPIGGGGLISGIAGYVKSISPETKVIGCLPENSPVMAKSIEAGKIIEMATLPTLSDATAGGIEQSSITFDMCKAFVDDYILVSEQEIKSAIITIMKTQHYLIEGAAGVAVAALLKNPNEFKAKNIVVILCGANISLDALRSVLN